MSLKIIHVILVGKSCFVHVSCESFQENLWFALCIFVQLPADTDGCLFRDKKLRPRPLVPAMLKSLQDTK